MTKNKEHNFLKEICFTALSVDKSVKFVAAVDNNGKLLAGKYKRRFLNNNSTLIKSGIFYLHYLIPAISQQQKQGATRDYCFHDLVDNNRIFHSNLADLGNNVYLVVIPLREKKDRYLCIYLESYLVATTTTSSSNIISHEQIISRISAALC